MPRQPSSSSRLLKRPASTPNLQRPTPKEADLLRFLGLGVGNWTLRVDSHSVSSASYLGPIPGSETVAVPPASLSTRSVVPVVSPPIGQTTIGQATPYNVC